MRERLYDRLVQLVSTKPWWVLLGAFVLLIASGVIVELRGLKMETRILDLLPKTDAAAVEYNDILKQYDSASQIIIGVKGGRREDKIAFIDRLEPRLSKVTYTSGETGKTAPYVKHAVLKLDTDYLTKHGLMLTTHSDLENLEPLFSNLEMADLLTAYNEFLEMEYIEDSAAVTEREKEDGAISNLKAIVKWLEGVTKATPKERASHAENAVDAMTIGDQYMFSQDESILIAMVVPTISIDKMEETMDGAKSLRRQVRLVQKDFPDLNIRMTGMPVLSLEEMEVTQQDMGFGTLWSLVLILVLFIVAFRMWSAPLLAIINLMTGIVWTLPLIALAFGRLNLMTTMFAIHLNAAYAEARARYDNATESIRAMYASCGNGVVTGALTTATAFVVLAFTGLDAFIELGVVLAGGIVLTLISSMTVLPAMYVVADRIRQKVTRNSNRKRASGVPIPLLGKGGEAVMRRPVAISVVVVFVLVTVFFAWKAKGASFESNMLEIEPADMPSVLLHREILREFEINPDFAMVSVPTVDDARKITDRIKKNRLVGQVDSISQYVPSAQQQKRRTPVIRAIAQNAEAWVPSRLTRGLPTGGAMAPFPNYQLQEKISDEEKERLLLEMERLNKNILEIGQFAYLSMKNRLARQCTELSGGKDRQFSKIINLKKQFETDAHLKTHVANWQRAYIPMLAERLTEMASVEPLSVDKLPTKIRDRFVSHKGENLVTIYAAVDLWDGNKMTLFNKATEKISNGVTGTVVLMDRLITLIGEKGILAIFLALGAVFVILLLDFRHLGYALVGMLPLLLGFAWMVGIFTLIGHKFDVANVMALPLILGIGIDDAVHILHGIQNRGIQNLPHVLKHTGRALVLTSMTTAIAFGSIADAAHRGLAGMGILLTLGVICCLVISIAFLPAVAALIFKKQEVEK
ncbi:MAG: MMPL family transporter [Deltaproteobacteria bacterium]|nr:MMPL family transporter [Deltaproteobacteria bacterium]